MAAKYDQRLMDMHRAVADGDMRLAPLMFQINLCVDREAILKWLFENHLTGDELVKWQTVSFGGGMLALIKEVKKRIAKEDEVRAIIVGKDYLPGQK